MEEISTLAEKKEVRQLHSAVCDHRSRRVGGYTTIALNYLLGITVPEPKGMELREEAGSDGCNLGIQLSRTRQGRSSREQDHSFGSLRKKH